MTRTEFINSIRSKYPQYNNIDDNTLFNKIIEKYPVYKNKITDTQIAKPINQQQAPVQQTPIQQTTVTPKKEETGFLEGVKTFLFGDEQKKPKAELISEEFVETKPEKPFVFSKPTPISLLDKEYNQKIKAVEDKYNALQENPNNYSAYVPSRFAIFGADPLVKTYKVDYTGQKEAEILNLNAEKLKRQGKNLTPQEQIVSTAYYTDNINKNKTKIQELSKQKKSYLEELKNVPAPMIGLNVFGYAKAIKNTWDNNSQVDANIAQAETDKKYAEGFLKYTKKGVDPIKNVDPNNGEELKKQMSLIDPSIASESKKAREELGEFSTIIMPTSKKREDTKSVALVPFIGDFIQLKSFKNLTSEQLEKTALEKSYTGYAKSIDSKLTPYYDKIQSDLGIPKSEVVGKIDIYLTAKKEMEEGLYPNIGNLSENDKKLFNNPDFKNIADTYSKTAVTQILDGKWRLLSMANVDLYNQEKANAFGTVNQVENIGRKEAVRSAILDKNVEEQGILSKAGFDKMLYGTAWTATKINDFTTTSTAAAAQIGTQLATAPFRGGEAYTPEWTENIINNSDLFDNLAQEDSHFKLSIFKDDKYIDRILPTGDKVKVQYDPKGQIINAFGGDMEYTINNPEVMQWLANDFETNKEEILKNGTSLWDTEGGKAVFLENAWNTTYKEIVEEMPSLVVGAGAGKVAGALIKGAANERRLAQGANFMINVSSNMTEQYPSIYKKYQEAAQDKDNPFPALVTSGALAFGTLLTSHLQSKAIGLTGDDINKVIMPNAIESSMQAMKAIRKEFAKIPNVALREKLSNAAIRKVMFQNVMSSTGKVLKEAAISGGQEAAEEVILEPLINAGANFLNEKITGDKAYNQETLKDLGFLDPDVAITSALTGGTLSSGMDLVKSMSTKAPFAKEDYLKTAFENEPTFTSMVDIMTQNSDNKFSETDQAKMMSDYKALKDSYNARKTELGVNDDALATLNFANPVIKGFANTIGLTEESLNKLNSGRTFDNAIIRQSLNERELAEKKIALDEEAAKGNISVSPEGTYRTVGSNPLTEELSKQISDYEQLQLSNNNLTTFIDTFNKETKPVQKQYIQELNQVTTEAPDLIRAKNSKEGSYAYKAASTAIMDKQMAMSQLEEVNSQIETAVIDGTDTQELQVQKQNLEKAIKASDKTIATLKKQYKAGRFDTQNETIDRFNEFKTADVVLKEKIQSLARVDATDEEIEQSEINDAYADYLDSYKALKKSNAALKKEYGVEVIDSKFTPMSLEEFQSSKNNIKEKNATTKKLAENKGTLGDVERLIDLEYTTGSKQTSDRSQVITPKNKEDINAILDDKEQVYEYAKRLGFDNKKSYAQTKKAVKTYLNKQLSTQDETRLEGVSAVFVEKTTRQVNGNPMFEVEGALYKPAGYSVSPTMMTQEERNTVLTNAVISEIAKQVFNNSLLLTPYNISQIVNKVIIESGFDTEVGIDNRSLQFIVETILALKSDLDAKGFSYKFNDDVVISKLSDDTERGYDGIATTPILTVVDTEGNVHLIDFKSFSAGNYEAASSGWSNSLTEIQAIFQDNGITVASINVVPIRVNNTSTTKNGLTNLGIVKNSFNEITNNDNPISRKLLQLTTSEPVLTTLEEEGLLTQEEVESFNDIPLDEEDAPITNADNLNEDSLVVFETETPVTTEEVVPGQVTVTETEEDMKAEDKNKATEITPREVVEETAQGFTTGLGKGVYIQVKSHKGAFYTIKIFGDTELANRYGKGRKSLKDVRDIYKYNNWFAPKSFEPKDSKKPRTYQLRYADTLTPVLSKNYVEFVQPAGFNEVINDITVAADIIGTGVEIVENNESGYNDTDAVQKDFKNKASLSIVNANGEKIAMVAPNSPLRENLKITNKKGLNRLQPTIATIKDVQFNDFNRGPLQSFSDWEESAIASGVLVPGEYEMVYIGVEDKQRVFKNQNGVVVPGKVPGNAPLGAAYLFMTNFPKKNIIIPMVTPKLSELGYTLQDLKAVLNLMDRNKLTANNAEGVDIYPNFIAELDALVKNNKLKNPKLQNLQFLLSSELGGKKLDLRASSTQSQIDKLDSILPYDEGNQDLNDSILAGFLLDRIITMNADTLGSHKIGVNPNILFADNALVLDNVKAKPKPRKQVLFSTVSKNKNTDLVKETYYESFMTESEDGKNYVFFHKSNATPEELAGGIDSRSFSSLRTSRTEKGTQYGVASYYTLPTDGERMVGGETYTVSVPKKKVYPMDSDPNGYKSAAEAMVPENTPFRMENIKKEMVRMAAEDGYLMAVGMWYFNPSGNPMSGPALRADAIVPLVPQSITYRKATEKQIDHPMKERIQALEELKTIVSKFENERNANQDYKEGYFMAQNTRVGKIIPSNVQFDTMVAGLPESMNSDIERARELVNMLNSVEETPSANSEVASATISEVVSKLKETGLANEVFEMTNDEIVDKLVELGEDNITLTTAGFVYNGDVYLNIDQMNLDTPIHEFGHLWLSWAKNNLVEVYARGLELAKSEEAEPYRQYVMETQPDLKVDSEAFLEEVLAQTIGDNGARLLEENSAKTKSWLQELWDAIGQIIGLSQFTADQIMDMTLNDYANAVAVDLLKGKKFADNTVNISSNSILENAPKVKINPEGHALSFVKESDLIDINSLIKSISENNQKVWFWQADQLGRGFYFDEISGNEHFLDAGPSFALDPENRAKNIIWASGATKSRMENLIKNTDYIFIVSGSPQKSKLFNKTIVDILESRVGNFEEFKTNTLNLSKITPLNNILEKINSWKELKETSKRKDLLNLINAQKNKNTALSKFFETSNAFIDLESLRDGFYRDNDFLQNDIMIVLKPTKVTDETYHSTYNKTIFGDVIGVPDRVINAFDIVNPLDMSTPGLTNRNLQATQVVPMGIGTKTLKSFEDSQKVQKSVLVAPGNRLFNNPLADATTIANKYNAENGLAPMVDNTITKIDKPFATRIAKAYDEMEATPFEAETQEAYKALIEETIAQHRAILAEGYKVEINNSEPYANAQEMIDDLRENKRMKIFSTESGFGDEPITEEQRKENLLLQKTEFKDANNVPLLANDVFRFVHDFFGHAKLGNGFGPVGEENAWRVHVQMYSPMARKAITSETRGQNSFVNFSGVNDEAFKLRDEARKLRQEGEVDEAAKLSEQVYEMMKFAEQKVGILPEWAYDIPSESVEDTTTIPDCV